MSNNDRHHIHTNEVTPQMKKSIVVRLVTAFIGLAIIIPCLFVGDWLFVACVTILLSLSTFEIIRAPKKKFPIAIYILTYLLSYVTLYFGFIYIPLSQSGLDYNVVNAFSAPQIFLSAATSFFALFIYFIISLFTNKVQMNDIFYLFTMTLLMAMGMQAVLYLRHLPLYMNPSLVDDAGYRYAGSTTLLIYVLLSIFSNDTGAYYIGILFGKHKMNEAISPKKTWEGFAGGVFLSLLISMSFALTMAHFNLPILPFLDLEHWCLILLISGINAILCPVGDLFFSQVKRHFKLKDFSNLLPGHGGFTDRLDSVMFCCLSSAIIVSLTYQVLDYFGQINIL